MIQASDVGSSESGPDGRHREEDPAVTRRIVVGAAQASGCDQLGGAVDV